MRFTVPGVPVAKARPRFNRRTGHTYTPEKSARFEDRVRLCAINAGAECIQGPVYVVIAAYWPSVKPDRKRDPRQEEPKATRPDADNVIKAVLDGLNGVCFSDDGQVAHVELRKLHAAQGDPPRCEVTVEAL